jgi:Fe-S cluster biosynthesis and repair protein YggX
MQLTISTDQRISNTLLLNASFIDNLGIMHGKMGISICFFHLARQTGNQIYEDYAGELIDEIYEEITANTPIDFENGLAGIGYGIEYLVQNGFIEADTDEVLEEFDNRIFKELIYNTPQDIGLLNGLVGIGAYFLKRIKNKASNDEKIPTLTNKQTLIHVIDELDRRISDISEIIREPCMISNKKQQTTNNKQRTTEPQTTNKQFDLTWDYPALLWFFAELYEQNIFNFKVEKIIKRLTKPLSNESNLPKLQSNRLLLVLALTKLQQITTNEPGTTNNEQQTTPEQSSNALRKESYGQTIVEQLSNLQTIINNLLTKINRNTINSELPPHNTTLRYGIPGIAWIYQQLYGQTSDNYFKKEMEYWHQLPFISEKPNEIFSGINNESLKAWGILEGRAGILLNNETINLNKKNDKI